MKLLPSPKVVDFFQKKAGNQWTNQLKREPTAVVIRQVEEIFNLDVVLGVMLRLKRNVQIPFFESFFSD